MGWISLDNPNMFKEFWPHESVEANRWLWLMHDLVLESECFG